MKLSASTLAAAAVVVGILVALVVLFTGGDDTKSAKEPAAAAKPVVVDKRMMNLDLRPVGAIPSHVLPRKQANESGYQRTVDHLDTVLADLRGAVDSVELDLSPASREAVKALLLDVERQGLLIARRVESGEVTEDAAPVELEKLREQFPARLEGQLPDDAAFVDAAKAALAK